MSYLDCIINKYLPNINYLIFLTQLYINTPHKIFFLRNWNLFYFLKRSISQNNVHSNEVVPHMWCIGDICANLPIMGCAFIIHFICVHKIGIILSVFSKTPSIYQNICNINSLIISTIPEIIMMYNSSLKQRLDFKQLHTNLRAD